MKKYILILLALVLTGSLAQAQDNAERVMPVPSSKNIFKISPFHFIEGTFLLSYERMLNDYNSSIMLSAGIHSRERFFDDSQEFGFQEELQYRFYLVPPRTVGSDSKGFVYFKGLYAGPYVSHRFRSRDISVFDWVLQQNVRIKENINEISGGVILGIQVALGDKFFVDFFTGGGIKRSFGRSPQNNNITIVDPGYNGVLPKIGFQFGVGF